MTSDQSDHNRQALIHQKMGFNQMRNSIYWLQRYMHQQNLSDKQIKDRLINMGKNIGATFSREITDLEMDLESLIKEFYYLTVRSKVKIDQNDSEYIVKDNNSALAKYQYDDIKISGDYITVSMIAEMLERFGYSVESFKVEKCRSYGDKHSEHRYIITPKEVSL